MVEEETNFKGIYKFSVLSWNVWFGAKGGWDYPQERWKSILTISLEHCPDVVGFQECTSSFLDVVAETTQFQEQYIQVHQPPSGFSYFVMLYVRKSVKIQSYETVPLKTTLGRRCEVVTVKKGQSLFKVGTVHIESFVTSPNIREIQLNTIFQNLSIKSEQMDLIILVGDFNFHDTEKENKVIEESQFTDTWPAINSAQDGFTFDRVVNPMLKKTSNQQHRLDRILFWDPQSLNWQPKHCELLGTEPIKIEKQIKEELSSGTADDLRIILPSDHFGLVASYVRKGTASGSTDQLSGKCE